MSAFIRPVIRALGITIASASVATAQAAGGAGTAKACEVNEGRPTQVGRATLSVQMASNSQDPKVVAKQLTAAIKGLTDNAERMDNQPGRNMVLGKALVLWSIQPDVPLVTKRGPLGYATNPEGTIDLALAIDTAFKVVETAHPECIAETSRWRGQKAWVGLVNKAIEKLNAEDADSAESVARQAISLNPYGPYGYVVLASVMQKKNKPSESFDLYRKSIEMAGRDTTYDDIRRQSLVYLGNLAADSAEAAADSNARRPYVQTAKTAFDQVLADKGAAEFRENARAGLCRVSIVAGDTASLRNTYKDQLASPAGFEYSALMNAGVCMARAEMVPEATALFAAAYEKNPYHRDALSNLAIMLLREDKHDQSLPLASRLVSVEPNNPESIQLLVLSYAGIAKRSRDARMAGNRAAAPATKTATKTKTGATATKAAAPAGPRLSAAASDSLFKVEKAFTDSAVAMNERREKLSLRVSLSDFNTSEEKATVAGSIVNQTSEAKATVTLKVDFLDRGGKVVSSKETTVTNIAANGSSRFSVVATPGKEIAAFRYTIR